MGKQVFSKEFSSRFCCEYLFFSQNCQNLCGQKRPEIVYIDIMIIDLHVHEKIFSKCSRMSLEQAVSSARRKGLDGICITDHESMDIRIEAADYLKSLDFPVFVGVEIHTFEGDVVAFGLKSLPPSIPHSRPKAQDFVNLVNSKKGFCFAAHPFRSNYELGPYLSEIRGMHGIEVLNGGNSKWENAPAIKACKELGLIPVAGSDAHLVEEVGIYATWFPEWINSVHELVLALKSGKGRPAIRGKNGKYTLMEEVS